MDMPFLSWLNEPVYVTIPDLQSWEGPFPARWEQVAKSLCLKCHQEIGYHVLAKKTAEGWEHDVCSSTGVILEANNG